jgi:hypothetical protein
MSHPQELDNDPYAEENWQIYLQSKREKQGHSWWIEREDAEASGFATVWDERESLHVLVQYVGVYAVNLCYGGPEEGGWWWDHVEHLFSIPLIDIGDKAEHDQIVEFLEARFPRGDHRSVRPEDNYMISAEVRQGQHESTKKPTYQ